MSEPKFKVHDRVRIIGFTQEGLSVYLTDIRLDEVYPIIKCDTVDSNRYFYGLSRGGKNPPEYLCYFAEDKLELVDEYYRNYQISLERKLEVEIDARRDVENYAYKVNYDNIKLREDKDWVEFQLNQAQAQLKRQLEHANNVEQYLNTVIIDLQARLHNAEKPTIHSE